MICGGKESQSSVMALGDCFCNRVSPGTSPGESSPSSKDLVKSKVKGATQEVLPCLGH